MAQNVKNSIINTIHSSTKKRFIKCFIDIETTIDAGLVYDDPFRFLSLELIDSIVILLKIELHLTNKIE